MSPFAQFCSTLCYCQMSCQTCIGRTWSPEYADAGLQNQDVLYTSDGPEMEASTKVFLDPNKLSSDGTVALGRVSFSDKGTCHCGMSRACHQGACQHAGLTCDFAASRSAPCHVWQASDTWHSIGCCLRHPLPAVHVACMPRCKVQHGCPVTDLSTQRCR